MKEKAGIADECSANVIRGSKLIEDMPIHGIYTPVECFDKDGKLKWKDTFKNLVTTVGKNEMLDEALAGSGYTAVVYMGLISSVGWSAVAAGDTMSSHSGWNEAGTGVNYPLYTGDRKTATWSAASAGSKALSAALSFTCETTGGIVKGCFLVYGSGASATKGDTGGVLFSAGVFTGGDKDLAVNDTLNVSYSTNLNA